MDANGSSLTYPWQVARDPRFLPLAGEFSAQRFQTQYGFLTDIHVNELKELRESLKRARKLLASSPRHLREEREQEIERLERTMKRAESQVNKDKRDKIEQNALQRVAAEEKEKRQQGKGAWYMKDSDKKEVLVRARYDALAAFGGKGAVKKAIEKKQKKTNQKEKKRRPFAAGSGSGSSAGNKRPRFGGGDGDGMRMPKRQRFS